VIFRPLEIMRGCSGANDQSRFLYNLNAFVEREAGTLLDTMFIIGKLFVEMDKKYLIFGILSRGNYLATKYQTTSRQL